MLICISFNPRTRDGRDSLFICTNDHLYGFQSTHPRWARHNPGQLSTWGRPVSIHAPAMGATEAIMTANAAIALFQSTHPRWARRFLTSKILINDGVSIHAPAMGATGHGFGLRIIAQSFNPRTRDGRDPLSGRQNLNFEQFQSTHPRWARQYLLRRWRWRGRFNPRTRDGRDHFYLRARNRLRGFNPRTRDGRDCPSSVPCLPWVYTLSYANQRQIFGKIFPIKME